jgi:hypothetical protein
MVYNTAVHSQMRSSNRCHRSHTAVKRRSKKCSVGRSAHLPASTDHQSRSCVGIDSLVVRPNLDSGGVCARRGFARPLSKPFLWGAHVHHVLLEPLLDALLIAGVPDVKVLEVDLGEVAGGVGALRLARLR